MANPQLEDGHTQIANEILEKLMKLHLSPNQWRVLLCIIRKTYGFKKKVDYIANSQIQTATGLGKSVVSRALRELQARNIITRNGKVSGIQKDWEKWKVSSSVNSEAKVSSSVNSEKLAESSTELAISSTELAESSTKVSSPVVAQKKKETIQKKEKKINKRKKHYGEFKNVLLSDEEYQKLKDKFGASVPDMIEALSSGIESKGYKYQSHYAAILNWKRREEKGKEATYGAHQGYSTKLPPRDGYTKLPDPRLDRLVKQQGTANQVLGSDDP